MSEKSYGIFRFEKRHWNALKNIEREANRSVSDRGGFVKSMIDWDKTEKNYWLKRTDNWSMAVDELVERYGARRRNDSVCLIDSLYTASPDWIEGLSPDDQERYFNDCVDFHVRHFCSGRKDLLINAVVHRDETSIHLAVASVPLIFAGKKREKWRLNAKKICGNQMDYRKKQELFYEEVGRKWGLEHHVVKEVSHRRHTKANMWYAEEMRQVVKEMNDTMDKMVAEFDKEKQHIDDYIAAAQHEEDRLLQNLVDNERDIKSLVVREWTILQKEHPEVAQVIRARNVELKKSGQDKGYLPQSSGRPREVRGREHDR